MSAIGKAEKFIKACKANGWKGNREFDYEQDYAKVIVERGPEKIQIEWIDNQLLEAPHYWLGGTKVRLHHAKIAYQKVQAAKPDIGALLMRQRRTQKAAAKVASAPKSSDKAYSTQDLLVYLENPRLPFDITSEEADADILKMCRGSTLVWRNRISGLPESCFIPREQNRDLKNSYFIGESADGSPYLSFRDTQGVFHAVAFSAMIAVL